MTVVPPVKICTKCGHQKPLDEFHVERRVRDGRSASCKLCISERGEKRRDAEAADVRMKRLAADKALVKAWRLADPKRAAFLEQRSKAKRRGILFHFDLEQWIDWWGEDDFQRRGSERGDLCQCRYGDVGPYSPSNCYKGTMAENLARPRPLPALLAAV